MCLIIAIIVDRRENTSGNETTITRQNNGPEIKGATRSLSKKKNIYIYKKKREKPGVTINTFIYPISD